MKPLIFVAVPYSNKNETVKTQRVDETIKFMAHLLHKNMYPCSPLVSGLTIAQAYQLPDNWIFWNEYCEVFLSKCDYFFVLQIDGWDKSTGVKEEIALAKKYNKDIFYIDPVTYAVTDKELRFPVLSKLFDLVESVLNRLKFADK